MRDIWHCSSDNDLFCNRKETALPQGLKTIPQTSDLQTLIPIFFINSEALKLEQIPGVRR